MSNMKKSPKKEKKEATPGKETSWSVEEPSDCEWMWSSADRCFKKLPESSSENSSRSQSMDSTFHSHGSNGSAYMCEHALHLAAINKHQKAHIDAISLRANKAEIGEKTMEKENVVLATRVSDVTTRYCTLGVEYAAAKSMIKRQRLEIVVTRGIAAISIGLAIICLTALFKIYSMF